jgi:hypothetical protein
MDTGEVGSPMPDSARDSDGPGMVRCSSEMSECAPVINDVAPTFSPELPAPAKLCAIPAEWDTTFQPMNKL